MAYIWTVRAAGEPDGLADADADSDADADGLSVVAIALADSLAATDGAATDAPGEVDAPPPQAARIAPATAKVAPKRAIVVRVI
jgi:hypothetical protein